VFKIEIKQIISLNKFIEGGPPILHTQSKNHQSVKIGIKFIILLDNNILRVFHRSYIIFAALKSPEDVTPCAIINKYAPVTPQLVKVKEAEITSLICATDE